VCLGRLWKQIIERFNVLYWNCTCVCYNRTFFQINIVRHDKTHLQNLKEIKIIPLWHSSNHSILRTSQLSAIVILVLFILRFHFLHSQIQFIVFLVLKIFKGYLPSEFIVYHLEKKKKKKPLSLRKIFLSPTCQKYQSEVWTR